jgi:hypothetical protein
MLFTERGAGAAIDAFANLAGVISRHIRLQIPSAGRIEKGQFLQLRWVSDFSCVRHFNFGALSPIIMELALG